MPRLSERQARSVLTGISLWKREQAEPDRTRAVSGFSWTVLEPLMEAYQQHLASLGAVDFDDVIKKRRISSGLDRGGELPFSPSLSFRFCRRVSGCVDRSIPLADGIGSASGGGPAGLRRR